MRQTACITVHSLSSLQIDVPISISNATHKFIGKINRKIYSNSYSCHYSPDAHLNAFLLIYQERCLIATSASFSALQSQPAIVVPICWSRSFMQITTSLDKFDHIKLIIV